MVRGIQNILSSLSTATKVKTQALGSVGHSVPFSILSPNQTSVNMRSLALEKENLLKQLRKKFNTVTKKVEINGIQQELSVFENPNSPDKMWIYSQKNDNLFEFTRAQWCDRQHYTEKAASCLYKLAGAKSRPVAVCKIDNEVGILRKFVPVETVTAKDAKLLREDFAADCWLGNWDALSPNNVGISEGQVIRTNIAGALDNKYSFGEDVVELAEFFDNNSPSKKFLTGMTRDELLASLKKVVKIRDDDIKRIIDENDVIYMEKVINRFKKVVQRPRHNGIRGPEYLKETLIARKNYIAKFLQKCESSPQRPDESIESYIRRIAAEMPKTEYKLPYEKLRLSMDVGHHLPYNLSMRDSLTPSQKKNYDEAYSAYERSKKRHVSHPNADEILTTDCIVHATGLGSLEDILKDGFTSKELRPKLLGATGDYTKTTLSADFWDIESKISIKDYFARDPNKCAYGELNFLYNNVKADDKNKGLSLAIVVNKKAVDKNIMKHSFLAVDSTSPSARILRADDNILPHDYPTHRIVPYGVPANAIDRIIIRANMPNIDDVTKRCIEKIKASGLDIKIYDTNGNLLWRPGALRYSRNSFRADVLNLLDEKVPAGQQEAFLKRFGLTRGEQDVLDGVPVIKNFVPRNDAEKEMLSLIQSFYQNSVMLSNPKVEKLAAEVLKAHPEFAMMMGKTQHETHQLSVGLHTLSLLDKARSNSRYQALSKQAKGILNHAAVMHDYGKRGLLRTPGHEKLSRIYAEKVLDTYDKIPQEVKNRILNQIENHHWFEAYNRGILSAEDFAKMFPTKEDREIAIILAKADFESVNKSFHLQRLVEGRYLTKEQYEKMFESMMDNLLKMCPNS